MHSTFQNNIQFSTAFTFGYMKGKGSDVNEFCSNLIMNKLYTLVSLMSYSKQYVAFVYLMMLWVTRVIVFNDGIIGE
jgi:hypothetical protein